MKKSTTDKKVSGNEAVSPVVGVMLMLVVTIIIAAVVSAFAGGITETTEKTPQVSLKATYSQTDGLTISHQGGDAIATIDTIVTVRLGDTFGASNHMAWRQNATTIVNKRGADVGKYDSKTGVGAWLQEAITGNDVGGSSGVKSFAPGDNAYIEPPYNTGMFMQGGTKFTSANAFDNVTAIGKEFWLEFSDKSGKIFAKTKVTIAP